MARIPVVRREQSIPGAVGVRGNVASAGAEFGALRQMGDEIAANAERVMRQESALTATKTVADARSRWTQYLIERQNAVEPGAPNFTPTLLGEFDDFAKKTLANLPPGARPIVQERLSLLRGDLARDALRFEAGERTRKAKADLGDVISLNANAVRSGADFAAALEETTAAIAASMMPAADRREQARAARSVLAVSLFERLNDENPAEAERRLNSGEFDAFLSPGQKDQLLDASRRARRETQSLLRSSVKLMIDDEIASIEATGQGRGLSEAQIRAAYPETADQIIRRIDRAKRLYGATQRIALAGPEEEAEIIASVSAAETDSEAYFSALRGAESGGRNIANQEGTSTAFGPYQFTEGTWRDVMRRHPELGLTEADRTDPAKQEIAVRAFTADNAAALERAGIAPTNRNLYLAHFLGAGDAVRVLTAPDADPLEDHVGAASIAANKVLQGGKTVGDVKAWAAGRMGGGDALLPGEFAQSLDERAVLIEAVQKKRKALAEDPAGYVLSVSPRLRERFAEAVEDPEKLPSALQAMDDMQAELGLPEFDRRLLPKSQADTIVRGFAGASPENAADMLEGMARQFGQFWPRVFGELVGAGLPEMARVLAVLDRPFQARARVALVEAMRTGRADLRKMLPPDRVKEIDDEIEVDLLPFLESTAFQPGGVALGQSVFDAVELVALQYARTMSGKQAVRKAADDVIMGRYNFRDGYRVPIEYDDGVVAVRAQMAMMRLKPEDLDPRDSVVLTEAEAEIVEPNMLRSAWTSAQRGRWVTNEDETGLIRINEHGQPVVLTGGEFLRLPFVAPPDEPVVDIGRTQAGEQVPLPPRDPATETPEERRKRVREFRERALPEAAR